MNRCIDGFLASNGFEAFESDPCLYSHSKMEHTYLLLYVDDLLLVSPSTAQLDDFKNMLAARFAIKSTRDVKEFLGLELRRSAQGLWLSHTKKT